MPQVAYDKPGATDMLSVRADDDGRITESKQRMLSGLGNTSRHVWLETLQRLSRRNVQSSVVTREELAPLGEAITRAPSAVNLLRDMQVSRNVACVLLNGYQMIGQVSLDNSDSEFMRRRGWTTCL